MRPGLAKAIMAPRIYRYEGVPVGPTWEQVSLVISRAEGAQPAQLRARAILLLLAIYGIRSGELCRLRLDDIDWRQATIHFQRSKSGRRDIYPLEATVGNAISRLPAPCTSAPLKQSPVSDASRALSSAIHISESVQVGPQSVTKKPFVLDRSAGGRAMGIESSMR